VKRAVAGAPLWSGNQRKVAGEDLARTGDNGLDEPARASQIKRRLDELPTPATPADLLAIQLDYQADWARDWHDLLLQTLRQTDPSGASRLLPEVIAELEAWDGQAASLSVAYRIVRRWHRLLAAATLEPIFAKTVRKDPRFNYGRLRYEAALKALHRDEPPHLVGPPFADWSALRAHVAQQLLEEIDDAGGLDRYTWGDRNRLAMHHPIGAALPGVLADFVNMPPDPQSGDSRLPRVAMRRHGASLRIIVAPGREDEGILHLPGGQSGNPLSPFFRAGHAAWLAGDPTPLQPGPLQHRLTLQPASP
jgi:penicillin amidase